MDAPEVDDAGAPDRPCVTCGHDGHLHVLREIEEAGRTIQMTYCEACDAPCDYVPDDSA